MRNHPTTYTCRIAIVLVDLYEFELVFKPIAESVLATYVDRGIDYESYLKWAICEMLETCYCLIVQGHQQKHNPYYWLHGLVKNACNEAGECSLETYFFTRCFNPKLIMHADVNVVIKNQTLIVEYYRELPYPRELIYHI